MPVNINAFRKLITQGTKREPVNPGEANFEIVSQGGNSTGQDFNPTGSRYIGLVYKSGSQNGWTNPAGLQESGYVVEDTGTYRVSWEVQLQGRDSGGSASFCLNRLLMGVRTVAPVIDATTGTQLFNFTDTDGDGQLDAAELASVVWLWNGDQLGNPVREYTNHYQTIKADLKADVAGNANGGFKTLHGRIDTVVSLTQGHLLRPFIEVGSISFDTQSAIIDKADLIVELID